MGQDMKEFRADLGENMNDGDLKKRLTSSKME